MDIGVPLFEVSLFGNRLFPHIVCFSNNFKNESKRKIRDKEKDESAKEELEIQVQISWVIKN